MMFHMFKPPCAWPVIIFIYKNIVIYLDNSVGNRCWGFEIFEFLYRDNLLLQEYIGLRISIYGLWNKNRLDSCSVKQKMDRRTKLYSLGIGRRNDRLLNILNDSALVLVTWRGNYCEKIKAKYKMYSYFNSLDDL